MSLLAYSNNKQPKEQKVYGVPSAFSIFKKILKKVLTFDGTCDKIMTVPLIQQHTSGTEKIK